MQQEAFDNLKNLFLSSTLITHANENKPFILKCDSSSFAIGGILSQTNSDNTLYPVAFYSRKLSAPERNYENS